MSARLSTGLAAGSGSVETRMSSGGAYASFVGDVSAAYPVGPVILEGGGALGRWTGFSTFAWRGAVAFSDTVLVPFTLRGFASAGDRGVGDPVLDTAQVVGFNAAGLGGGLDLGPFRVSGRYSGQSVDRELGLNASWDRSAVLDSAAVDISTWEVRLEGPLIPLGGIIPGLEPIRIRGYYRSNSSAESLPLYVPDTMLRAELALTDTFFQGNLELWLSVHLERKGPRRVPVAGDPDVMTVDAYTWPGGQLMVKIGDFRFFYRFDNPGGQSVADIPGATFPLTLGVFGIRWEFFN